MIVRLRRKRRIAMEGLLLTRLRLTPMLRRTRNGKRVQSLLASLGMTMSSGPLLEKLKEGDVVTIFGSKSNRIMHTCIMQSLLQINKSVL